jgi:hypothetical protein
MTTIATTGMAALSTHEKVFKTNIETAIDAKIPYGVNTTGTNGEVGVTGLTTNDGIIVTPLVNVAAHYVTVGANGFTLKAAADDSAITGKKIAWAKLTI